MVADTEKRIHDLISTHREYRLVFYKILRFCLHPRSYMDVQEEVCSYPEMEIAIQPPAILLKWLEKSGVIEQITNEGDGRWLTTLAGRQVLEVEEPGRRLRSLLSDREEFEPLFLQLLAFCQTPRQISEIEKELAGNPSLTEHNVHPAYFVHELAGTGGLEWIGKRWGTSEAGKGVITKE
ncbi:MAG: hypothetical protein MUO58_05775 [Anaerolineales bacterium]|nr:hypothetical protein [Anaerolineales bacterium]